MRKKWVAFFLLYIICALRLDAQTDIQKQFKALQVNSSPAFVVLGIEPENIQRPNSPTDFVAIVQSATINGKLQPNFAMETSPYYWSHPKKNSRKFNVLDYVSNNDYWQNLAKSITFSFATSPSDSFTFGKIPVGTGIGIGFHIQLVQGRISKNVSNNLMAWSNKNLSQNILTSIVNKLEATHDNEIDDLDGWLDNILSFHQYDSLPAQQKEIVKKIIESKLGENAVRPDKLTKIKKLRTEFQKQSAKSIALVNEYQFPLTREGFMLEFAFANACVAQNSKWDSMANAKTAIWLTPSYRFNVNKDPTMINFIDVMAVARLTLNSNEVDVSNYFDLGGNIQWIHNRLSVSAEGIYRRLTNKPATMIKGYTYKTGVTFSYKLNEMVTFKTTFGNSFDGNSTQYTKPSNLFIVGGFNFGFSNFFPPAKS